MIWQISVAVIALAFLALVIFLCVTLVSLSKSLKVANQTINDLRLQVYDLTNDVNSKLKTLDPLFHSLQNVGETIDDATGALKKVATKHFEKESEKEDSKQKRIVEAVEWGLVGISILQKFLSRR